MLRLSPFLSSIIAAAQPGTLPCLLATGAAIATILFNSAVAAQNTVIKSFSSGDAINSVGVIEGRVDAPPDGPQAIYAADDGSLYLLDQINGRVLRFDAKKPGAQTQSLELPEELRPTDIVVRRGNVYVWDGAPQALQPTGREDGQVRSLTRTRSTEPPDEATLSAFAQMGSQALEAPDALLGEKSRAVSSKKPASRQVVASRGRGSVIADITISNNTTAEIDLREHVSNNPITKLRLRVRDRIGVVEFLEVDNNGRMFVLTENVPNSSYKPASAFVVRFSSQGVQESVYDIPLQESVAVSRRFVAISPEGDVYFLRTLKNKTDLLGVGSRNVRADAVIENPSQPRYAGPDTGGKGPIAAVLPLNRQQVIQTAFAFEGLQWRLTPLNYGTDPDTACTGFNRIRRPGYLAGKLNQEVRGVPYCWGCSGSLNKFRANVANGMMAGNVCTHNAPRPDVTGVDCSAFVSAAWGLSRHFTTAAIPSITRELSNPWDLQPGDALNKAGSHVMLFLRFTPDRKAEVMESSTGGCNGKVCRNVYPLSSLLARGYKPVRFSALENTQAPAVPVAEAQPPDAKSKYNPAAATDSPPAARDKRRRRGQ